MALGPHVLRAEAPTLGRVESGVMSSPRLRMCHQHPVHSSFKAGAHRLLLQILPPPDFPTSAKGTNLITRALKCQTPADQVSVPQDDSYFGNLSRISLFFSTSAAKFQLFTISHLDPIYPVSCFLPPLMTSYIYPAPSLSFARSRTCQN